MAVTINPDNCIGCGICVDMCPNEVLEIVDDIATMVNESECAACGICETNCEYGAIKVDVEEKRFKADY